METYIIPDNLKEMDGGFSYIQPDNLEFIDDFMDESNELMAKTETHLLILEGNPQNRESIDLIFRNFHSIKGSASFIGLNEISTLCHWAESLLDKCRNGSYKINRECIEIFLNAADILKNLLVNLKIKIINLRNGITICNLEKIDISEIIIKLCGILNNHRNTGINENTEVEKNREIKTESNYTARGSSGISEISNELNDSMRITTRKLDSVSELTGELLISLSLLKKRVEQTNSDKYLFEHIHNLELNLDMLRMQILKMRMLPIKNIYDKLSRQVRDLTVKSNKKINYLTEGGNVEVDKNIIDEIYAPLTHIIRNSIDHGIEIPEVRFENSKNETGDVSIKTENKGDNILITISDDGAGLDSDKIKKKAVEKNILTNDAAAKLNDTQIFNLIFQPGFSTAETVTEISGRGVGMDVVKRSVEKLGGKIEMESAKNQGTIFKITLPLSASIIEGLIAEISGAMIIFPILKIKFTLTVNMSDIKRMSPYDSGSIIFQNRNVPVIDLNKFYRFCFDDQSNTFIDGLAVAVIVEYNGADYALLVNRVISQEKIVCKKLSDKLTKICGIKAGTILGDGSVGFLVEPNDIIANRELLMEQI